MSAETDHDIAAIGGAEDDITPGVTGPDDADLTVGETPAQKTADDETRAPEQEGNEESKT